MRQKRMVRSGRAAALCLVLMLRPALPVHGLLVHSYGLDEIASEAELVAIVRIEKITPMTFQAKAPLKMRASLVDATISARVPRYTTYPKEYGRVRFVAGGRVWGNKFPKYRFEVGQHWFVCLKQNPFTEEFHVMLNSTNDWGPLTAIPIPSDVLKTAVRGINNLKGMDYSDVELHWHGDSPVDHMFRDILSDNAWAGSYRERSDKHLPLFFSFLKLHEIILSSKHLFRHFPVEYRLGADGKPERIESVRTEGLTFGALIQSIGGLQLPVIRKEVEAQLAQWHKYAEQQGRDEEVDDDKMLGRLRRYAALRKKAQTLAVKLLTRLRSAVRRDPKLWVDPYDLGWALGALYKDADFERREIPEGKYDLGATLETYIETIRQR